MILWIFCGFVMGSIAGSFIATLVIRWPDERATSGRSACDSCGAQLRWFELMPLVSFLAQRGKCRRCAAVIPYDHFWIELTCAFVGALSFAILPGVESFVGAYFGWMLVALTILDVRHFWLPDRLTFLLGATGFAAGLLDINPPLADRLIGGAAGYFTLAVIAWVYRQVRQRDGMGAGDPKLLGAIGLWLGWQTLPFVLLGASAIGFCAILYQIARKRPVTADTRLPLGALMAVAAIPVWLLTR